MNTNERWQTAARTVYGLYGDAWGALRGCSLGFHPPSCARLCFHSDPPPPLATVHQLQCSQNAHWAFHQDEERCKFLTWQKISTTPDDH